MAFTQLKIFRSYMISLPLKPRAKLQTQDSKWKGVHIFHIQILIYCLFTVCFMTVNNTGH